MRKNVKNDKVLKAITIGLATMIAITSAPANVWADDEADGQVEDHETHDHEDSTVAEPEQAVQCDDAAADVPPAVESVSAAAEAVATAEDPVVPADDIPQLQQQVVEAQQQALEIDPNAGPVEMTDFTVQQELAAGIGFLNDTQENLEDASCGMWDAAETEAAVLTSAKDSIDNADNYYLPSEETQLQAFDTAATQATGNANAAISNANTANTSESREEAEAARDTAIGELSAAEAGLAEAEKTYDAADAAVKQIQKEYDELNNEHEKAVAQAAAAAEELKGAKTNAQAANERLKAAQSKVAYLEQQIGKYDETLDELKAIQEQSYAMMVIYSRLSAQEKKKDENGNVVKDENGKDIVIRTWNNKPYSEFNEGTKGGDGTLDIAATVKRLKEEAGQDQIDFMAENINGDMKKVGRYLTRLIVKCMIENDEGIDLDDEKYEFKFGVDEKTGKAGSETIQAGTVYKNDKYFNDAVYVGDNLPDKNGNQKTDGYGNILDAGDKVGGIKWYSFSRNAGRENYVVVTYKDKDGNLQTRKYNYILKNSKYGDTTDIENGLFYLAEIGKDENGNTTITRVESENNFDNYGKLLSKIQGLEKDKKALQDAKKAVDDAAGEVDALEKEIAKLESFSLDEVTWNTLKNTLEGKLNKAKADLADAETRKNALEDRVEEARRAVASIDLSRFTSPGGGLGGPGGGTGGGTDPAPAATSGDLGTVIAPAFTLPTLPFGLPGLATTTPGTGVLGVRTGDATGAADADGGAEGEEITGNTVRPAANRIQSTDNRKVVRLENEEVPLADIPFEEGVEMSWWWLLIIFLLGATGKKMYDKYQERKEAKNLNK